MQTVTLISVGWLSAVAIFLGYSWLEFDSIFWPDTLAVLVAVYVVVAGCYFLFYWPAFQAVRFVLKGTRKQAIFVAVAVPIGLILATALVWSFRGTISPADLWSKGWLYYLVFLVLSIEFGVGNAYRPAAV